MNNKRAIILIGIIVTVIILIIAMVALILNSNKEDKEPVISRNKIVEENLLEENIVNEIIEENEEKEELPTISKKGVIAKQRSVFKDENGKQVTLPEGFAVVEDSPNVSDGLVISDVANDDLENSKEGNQFVWVPVETPTLDVSQYDNETDINYAISECTEKKKYPMAIKLADGNYKGVLYRFEAINENTVIRVNPIVYSEKNTEREPANLEDSSDNIAGWTQTDYQEEYNALVKRVKNDGGFWIARFETSIDDNKIAQSKKDKKVLSDISWYEMYGIEKTLINGSTTSHMIWGSQWDQVIIWLKNIKNNNTKVPSFYILDSTNMGNYLNSEIKETEKTTIKKAGEAFRFKSGEVEDSLVKNIYDLAGNVWEWTMEANFTTSRTVRGGDCSYDGNAYPVTARFSFKPTYDGEKLENIGSRMTIY